MQRISILLITWRRSVLNINRIIDQIIRIISFILFQTVYGGTFESAEDEGSKGFEEYKKGVTMGCWGLFVYSASSAAYACERKKLKTSNR